MLTYDPFETENDTTPSGVSSASGLRGNPLEGTIGPVNVGEAERYGSIVGGAALVLTGLSRRSLPGLLTAGLGGLFIMRGVAGHCRLYSSMGVSTAPPGDAALPDPAGQPG